MQNYKEGLIHISKRTGQLRYSVGEGEPGKWLQPLSAYPAGEDILRGQPLSIATTADAPILAGLADTQSYVVLTNPSHHQKTIGLALESVKKGEMVHIQSLAGFSFNLNKAGEYNPPFTYADSVGKLVFVKGGSRGELTINPEESYFGYKNIIQVGFVTDAPAGADEKEIRLEIQLEGDGRGPIGATQYEAILGEDALIPSDSSVRIFALGQEDASKFQLNLSFTAPQSATAFSDEHFIALNRMDGKTVFIFMNGSILPADSDSRMSVSDVAFLRLAKYHSTVSGEPISIINLAVPRISNGAQVRDFYTAVLAALTNAFQTISGVPSAQFTPAKTIDNALKTEAGKLSGFYNELTASIDGGYYEVYVSEKLRADFFSGSRTTASGSYENKGKAVLADIRIPTRQNILGAYFSGQYDTLLAKDSKAIFLHAGEFNALGQFAPGSDYYLGTRGAILTKPSYAYDRTIRIGAAQTDSKLLCDMGQPALFYDGELPVGHVKPSVKGLAEFGFLLMDGTTEYPVLEYQDLFERVQNYFAPEDLKIRTDAQGEQVFTLPRVSFDQYPAQIKYINRGVYSHVPRIAVKRLFGYFEDRQTSADGTTINAPGIPRQEITDLVLYGPLESGISGIDLASLDVHLFVDTLGNSETGQAIDWEEIPAGFMMYNNFQTFGYRWKVEQVPATPEYPFGRFYLATDTVGGQGVSATTEAGCPPVPVFGKRWKLFISKRETFDRQFDMDGIFANYVSQSLMSDNAEAGPTRRPVSGKAVYDYITNIQDLRSLLVKEKLTLGTKDTPAEAITFGQFTHTGGFSLTDAISMKEVIAFKNGRFSYTTTPEVPVGKRDGFSSENIIPKSVLEAHEAEKITASKEVHGIKQGSGGNFNADKTDGFHVGLFNVEFVNANNQEDLSFIPRVAQLDGNGKSTMDIGSTIRYHDQTEVATATQSSDIKGMAEHSVSRTSHTWTHEADSSLASAAKILKNVISSTMEQVGSTKKVITYYNFIPNVTSNLAVINAGVTAYQIPAGSRTSADNIAIQNANTLIAQVFGAGMSLVNYPTIGSAYAGGINANDALLAASDLSVFVKNGASFDLATMAVKTINAASSRHFKKNIGADTGTGQAMRSLSELPLARFQYKNEADGLKKYLGFIIEDVDAAKTALSSEGTANPTTHRLFPGKDTFDIRYTDSEVSAIRDYLSLVTDNSNLAQNILSSVGLLFAGAKETQNRLLRLESSVEGADAPSLPGTRPDITVSENVTQEPLYLGLNRVVRALSKEIFDDFDPTAPEASSGTAGGNPNLSRVDRLDGQVNGAKARTSQDEAQSFILLDATKGATYPATPAVTDPAEADPESGKTAPNFDGLNEAVNRIIVKLNALTVAVQGKDNINSAPQRLDTIRANIEHIIKEVFFDGADETAYLDKDGIQSTPFTGNLSRIDLLSDALYKYTLSYDNGNQNLGTEANPRLFNGKPIKHGEIGEDNTAFTMEPPSSKDDLETYASLLDILVDTIGSNILPLHNNLSNPDDRLVHTISSRLSTIEAAMDVVVDKLNKSSKLETVGADGATVAADYSRIKNLQDFCFRLSQWSGIHFEPGSGQTGAWEADAIASVDAALSAKAGMHNVIADVVTLLKKNINTTDYLHSRLGVDYFDEEYTGAPEQAVPQETYTLTSDIAAILKTLFGVDDENKTAFTHKAKGTYATEDFSSGNIITNLTRLGYATPPRLKSDGTTAATSISDTAFFDIDKEALVADENPISHGNRSEYFGEILNPAEPRPSRFVVIEDAIRAIRKFIGMDILPSSNPTTKFGGVFSVTADGGITGLTETSEVKSLLQYVLNNKTSTELREELGPTSGATASNVYTRLKNIEDTNVAQGQALGAQNTEITSIKAAVQDLQAAESADDTADAARFSAIESDITAIKTKNTAQDTKISNLETSTTNNADGLAAEATARGELGTRVSAAENSLSTVSSNLQALHNEYDAFSTQARQDIDGLITSQEYLGTMIGNVASRVSTTEEEVAAATRDIESIESTGVEITTTGGATYTTSLKDLLERFEGLKEANKDDIGILNIMYGLNPLDVYNLSNFVGGQITYKNGTADVVDYIASVRYIHDNYIRKDTPQVKVDKDSSLDALPFLKAAVRNDDAVYSAEEVGGKVVPFVKSTTDSIPTPIVPSAPVVITEKQVADMVTAVTERASFLIQARLGADIDNLSRIAYKTDFTIPREQVPYRIEVPDTTETTLSTILYMVATIYPVSARSGPSAKYTLYRSDGALPSEEGLVSGESGYIIFSSDGYEIRSNTFTILQ